jgi:ABC-type ATPase involved in cell division
MLRYSLIFHQVTLPAHPPGWPAPFDLKLGLKEVLLIEGVSLAESEALLEVAATLRQPLSGQVWHWGIQTASLPRSEVYDLRRQIAFISPGQVLLHRLTLLDNIALGPCYHQGGSAPAVRRRHAALLDCLGLGPYLLKYPSQVPEAVYYRALWARELAKAPELTLAVLADTPKIKESQKLILPWLENYLGEAGRAAIIMGQALKPWHHLAHRLLRLRAGRLHEERFLEHKEEPLTAFLALV